MRIHAIVIAWPGVEANAANMATQLQGHADFCSVIYSHPAGDIFTGAGEWLQVPDAWYFGRKFSEALRVFRGDVLLLLHADAHHEDWRLVVDACRQQFERCIDTGLWAPVTDFTHWSLEKVALRPVQGTPCHSVVQTDCIVCAFSEPVVNRLKSLDYTDNNLGWGIDWAAIAYAYSHNLLVVQDASVPIRHAAGTGYDKHEALRQMEVFMQQLTMQEQVMVQLLHQSVSQQAPLSEVATADQAPELVRSKHQPAYEADTHVSKQLARLQASERSPWRQQARPGYARGIDFYAPEQLKWVMSRAAAQFHEAQGKWPDMVEPTFYAEKIFWLKFFGQIKVPESGNKLATPVFIPAHLRHALACPEVVWRSNQPVLPANHELPAGVYYLKANQGSGLFKRVVYPLAQPTRLAMEQLAAKWLKTRYGLLHGEWWYNAFEPMVFLEKSVCGDADSISWNIPVINGHTPVLAVHQKRLNAPDRSALFDSSLQPLPQPTGRPCISHLQLPDTISDMFMFAREIAKPFRFVRVDFLQGMDGRPYLAELTFSPGNALTKYPPKVEQLLTQHWIELE